MCLAPRTRSQPVPRRHTHDQLAQSNLALTADQALQQTNADEDHKWREVQRHAADAQRREYPSNWCQDRPYQLAKKIIAITGSNSRIRRVSYEQAYGVGFEDLLRRRPSLEKIRRLTDYHPGRSLDEIIARTVRHFKGD